MKFETYDKKKDTIKLKLIDEGDGDCYICAIDEFGNKIRGSSLIRFTKGGIYRFLNVSEKLGLKLDDEGRI